MHNMQFLMIYLTESMSFRAGTGNMPTSDALALKALIETGGTYAAILHNADGSLYIAQQ